MSLINHTIPGLFNGVSQQPVELRLDTQCEEQINCYGTIVGCLRKRPPTQLIATSSVVSPDSFIYSYSRGLTGTSTEKYFILIENNKIRVFDTAGNPKTVNGSTSSYLSIPSGVSALTNFAATTIGDTTFIVNKSIKTTLSSSVGTPYSGWDTTFYYWVKRTNPDTSYPANNYTYYIYDNGTLKASYQGADAKVIASNLASQLNSAGYSATSIGSVVKVTTTSGHVMVGDDSWGSQASYGWQGKVNKLQDLPQSLGFEDTVIHIIGDDKNAYTGFYVKYNNGIYAEIVKPGLQNTINPATMPHQLVRNADGTFTFSEITYVARKAGDYNTAPVPSFIDNYISDVFFFKNRLGFISNENVIMSETGEYFNFFPTTITDVLDSEPIDVAVDSNQVVNLRYALPFNSNLLLFSDKSQFTLQGSDVLSPKTVSANQSTAFEFNQLASPVNLGPNVYFSVNVGNYSAVREYFMDPNSISNDAADITAHVPTYLPKNISKLVGNSGMDLLFAITPEAPDTIFVYKFFWNGDKKEQSAWSKWTFDGTIKNIEIIDNILNIMIIREGLFALETLNLELAPFEELTYLDRGTIPYEAKYTMSKWRIKSQGNAVDNSRGRLQVRTFSVSVETGSTFDFEIVNNTRTRTVSGIGVEDKKALVMGHTDRVSISIVNNDAEGKGFQINSCSFEGNYTTRSRSI